MQKFSWKWQHAGSWIFSIILGCRGGPALGTADVRFVVLTTMATIDKIFARIRIRVRIRIRITAVALREGGAYYYWWFFPIFTIKKSFAFIINYYFTIRAVGTARTFFFNFIRSTSIRRQVNFISDNLVWVCFYIGNTSTIKQQEWSLWQYGLWSFQTRDTKFERLLHKNQHTQRKLLNFWVLY